MVAGQEELIGELPCVYAVLTVRGADGAIGFCRWAFGDEEMGRTANPVQTTCFWLVKRGFAGEGLDSS